VQLSSGSRSAISAFTDLVRDIDTLLKMKGAFSAGIMSATKSLRERSQFFFSLLPRRWAGSRSDTRPRIPGREWRRVSGAYQFARARDRELKD